MSPTCSLLHFRDTASSSARCSQSFTAYDPESCPRRGSPHHKIVMHANSTVHGSNEPWLWMLTTSKGCVHIPLPQCVSPAQACVRNVFTRPAGSEDGSLHVGRKTKSQDVFKTLTNTQSVAQQSRISLSV